LSGFDPGKALFARPGDPSAVLGRDTESSLPAVGRGGSVGDVEQDIAVHSYIESISHADLDRRLYVQVASGDLRAEFRCLLADGASGDLRGAR
jgi:hypothetical protein